MIKIKSIDGTRMVEGRRIMNSNGTPSAYIVTEDGNVYSEESERYKALNYWGDTPYLSVSLFLDSVGRKYTVHKLVADHFLSNPYNFECVNHKDCNTSNNDYHNLEHCTYEYNSRFSVIHGNRHYTKENMKKRSTLSIDQIKGICEMIEKGVRNRDIAKEYGVHKNYVANIKNRSCHTAISKYYDFGDGYEYYGDRDLVGNEGNEYIPPLSDEEEPKYIKHSSPEYIEKICEALSDPHHYLSTDKAASMFNIDANVIKNLRKGLIYPKIVSKYNINNNQSTIVKATVNIYPRDYIEDIFKKLNSGNYTLRRLSNEIGISRSTIMRMVEDPIYKDLAEKYPVNIKNTGKGHPLTREDINKTVDLIKLGIYKRQDIADMVGISLPSVVKIKRMYKNNLLL